MNHRPLTPKMLALIGILGALSAVLLMLEIPLPFAPGYMKFEISDLPALFAGFFAGPGAAALTEIIKILLKLLLSGTGSAFVGEGMNLLCACFFCHGRFPLVPSPPQPERRSPGPFPQHHPGQFLCGLGQ